jgi:C-terminal processing protease CtpA/Prc
LIIKDDWQSFYKVISILKKKFNLDNKSEYLRYLNLDIDYSSKRDEMGGFYTKDEAKNFSIRIKKLLDRD